MAKIIFGSKKSPINHKTDEDDLLTVYDIEYTTKSVPRTKPYIPPELMPELARMKPDPISEAFRQELHPDYMGQKVPDVENYETGAQYYCKLKDKKPSIVKVVDKEVNQDVLAADHILHDDRTVYQVDFCKTNDYCSSKAMATRPYAIPDIWKPTPLTLYRLNYRDHTKTAGWKIVPDPATEPPSFFNPNPQERELLQVRTGVTEYEGVIGKLGTEVIKREYHGKIPPLPGQYVALNENQPTPPPRTPKTE